MFKSILLIIVLLSMSLAQAAELKKLKFTHGLFVTVLAEYMNDELNTKTRIKQKSVYRPKYLALKNYYLTFLNQWKEHIDSGNFATSEDILKHMSLQDDFIGRHFKNWHHLFTFKDRKNRLSFGYNRNQFLSKVLNLESESGDLETFIIRSLESVNIILVVDSKDYKLAQTIAHPFTTARSEMIREKAIAAIKAIPRDKWVSKVTLGFNLLAVAGGGVKGLTNKSVVTHIQNLKNSLKSVPLFAKTTKGAQAIAVKGRDSYNNLSTVQKTLLGSVAIHGGVIAPNLKQNDPEDSIIEKESDSLYKSVELVVVEQQALNNEFLRSHVTKYHSNFKTHYKLSDKNELLSNIKENILNDEKLDYLQVFLDLDKYDKKDKRSLEDTLNYEFIANKSYQFRDNLFDVQIDKNNFIDDLRQQKLIPIIENYKRDYATITSILSGWGGNCTSQTQLLTSALLEHKEKLQGYDIAIAILPNHIETVLVKDEQVHFLVSGEIVPQNKVTLLKPSFLLYTVLNKYNMANDLELSSFIYSQEKSEKSGRSDRKVKSLLSSVIPGFLNSLGFRDKGLLDFGKATDTIKLIMENIEFTPSVDVPESSKISFTKSGFVGDTSAPYAGILTDDSVLPKVVSNSRQSFLDSTKIILNENDYDYFVETPSFRKGIKMPFIKHNFPDVIYKENGENEEIMKSVYLVKKIEDFEKMQEIKLSSQTKKEFEIRLFRNVGAPYLTQLFSSEEFLAHAINAGNYQDKFLKLSISDDLPNISKIHLAVSGLLFSACEQDKYISLFDKVSCIFNETLYADERSSNRNMQDLQQAMYEFSRQNNIDEVLGAINNDIIGFTSFISELDFISAQYFMSRVLSTESRIDWVFEQPFAHETDDTLSYIHNFIAGLKKEDIIFVNPKRAACKESIIQNLPVVSRASTNMTSFFKADKVEDYNNDTEEIASDKIKMSHQALYIYLMYSKVGLQLWSEDTVAYVMDEVLSGRINFYDFLDPFVNVLDELPVSPQKGVLINSINEQAELFLSN